MGSRVDVWQVKSKEPAQTIECGYAKNYHAKYTQGQVLGRGGFGVVAVVTDKETGREYACKSINKWLEGDVSDKKQARHIGNIRREVAVLRRLRGTLNVAHLKQVYEDNRDVHVVMEYCRGGELWHRIGNKHYAERTVASFMRAVLRTLSQCHSHRILHRDVKPGNFMLLNDADRAPLKAIDFGLAVFYDPGDLPRTDLGLEGTPWFMAPEVMSSEVYPSSDIWSAGVMAYQLLSGTLPFDDRRRPHSPALSVVWQAILTQEPSFSGKAWQDISPAAIAFVKRLLNKRHDARPAAKEALQDPWLQGNSLERTQGKPLDATVVQRLQRYSQTNVLKRTIFELIAEEIIKTMTQQHIEASPDPSYHESGHSFPKESVSPAASLPFGTPPDSSPPNPAWSPLTGRRKRSLTQEPTDSGTVSVHIPRRIGMSAHGGLEYHRAMMGSTSLGPMSVHDANNWEMIKAALETAKHRRSGSVHGGQNFSKDEGSKEQYRKAARIALDTSAHAGSEYYNFMRLATNQAAQDSSPNLHMPNQAEGNLRAALAQDVFARARNVQSQEIGQRRSEGLAPVASHQQGMRRSSSGGFGDIGKRGQSEYAQFLRRASLEQCSPTATEGASPDASPTRRDSIDASARASIDWPHAKSYVSARSSFEWQPSGSYPEAAVQRHLLGQTEQAVTRQNSIEASARASIDWPHAKSYASVRNSFEWQQSGSYPEPMPHRSSLGQTRQAAAGQSQNRDAQQHQSAEQQVNSSKQQQSSLCGQQTLPAQQQADEQHPSSSWQIQAPANGQQVISAQQQSDAQHPSWSPSASQLQKLHDVSAHTQRQTPAVTLPNSAMSSPFSTQQLGASQQTLPQQAVPRQEWKQFGQQQPPGLIAEASGQAGQQATSDNHVKQSAQPQESFDQARQQPPTGHQQSVESQGSIEQARQQPHTGQQPKQAGGEADRRLTFQEILRQQLEAHSRQVSSEDGSTAEPSHPRTPSPLPTPPMSVHRPHMSFEDMLRQQLGQQVAQPASELTNGSQHLSGRASPFRRPQSAQGPSKPTAFQDMLRQQLSQDTEQAQPDSTAAVGNGVSPPTVGPHMAAAEQQQEQQQQQQAASDGSQHDNDDQPHAMAEITATGLRLTDAEGMSSLVPLHDLKEVMMRLTFSTEEKGISVEQLAEGLRGLGYELCSSELGVLMHQLAVSQQGQVGKPAFLASQLDWQNFQQNFKDQWLDCAKAAFASVDATEKGLISSGQLVNLISSKLPAEEVEHAVEQALMEAGCADLEDLDFDAFLKLMRVNSLDSLDSLDQYDSRLNSTTNLQGLDSGNSGYGGWDGHSSQLEVVPE